MGLGLRLLERMDLLAQVLQRGRHDGHEHRFTQSALGGMAHQVAFGAGMQLFKQDKYEMRAEYKAQVGKDYRNQALSLRVAIPF